MTDSLISLIDETTTYTKGDFESAMTTLYEGAALAIIVIFTFLRNWRATIITAVAVSLSIIPTFFVMDWLGFSLNTVSLLGISLITGEIGMTVFAPVSFMSGIAGQYIKQFGLTVAVAVLFSLLVARQITPIMAAYFTQDEREV